VQRKPENWDSEFGKFVRSYGVILLAARLHVDPSAVYHWIAGSTSPHPSNALAIQRLAKRRHITLSLDKIYEHFQEEG
jgi:hypothetical protein